MRIIIALLLTALPAFAQDRDGNDTPGEWKVTHHKPFGLWDSFCDERKTGDSLEERCYLRYVDVFSPRPNFGAMFAFITPDGRIEFGIETGTAFKKDGFALIKDGTPIWTLTGRPCLFGGTCTFEGEEATALTTHMRNADSFRFDFIDRHETEQSLTWDMTRYSKALDDMLAAAATRGL